MPLLEAADNLLEALLAPVPPEVFVNEFWARKTLFVKGFPHKYEGLFDAAGFSQALSAPGPIPDNFLRASFDPKTGNGRSAASADGAARSSAFRASIDQAVPLFDAGATLCLSQIECRLPALVPFLAQVKRQLGYPGRVSFNAYLSPPGSGFNWHFDSRVASTLQIEGSKRWRYSAHPAIEWPRANGTLGADGTPHYADPNIVEQGWEHLVGFNEADVTEVLLEPGDLLIIPAGVWHEACGGVGGSLALNLSFTPLSYSTVMRNLLDALFLSEASWRGPAPVLAGGQPGCVDARGVAAISEQIARVAATLQTLRGDSAAVVRIWEALVQNPNPNLRAAAEPSIATKPVEAAQRLCLRPDGNYYAMLADGGTRLCLTIGMREIDLTGPAVPFVQRLLLKGGCVASECVGWAPDGAPFSWSDVQSLLTSLKREGLVVDC